MPDAEAIIRSVSPADAEAVSRLVRSSFDAFIAQDWTAEAREAFLAEASGPELARRLALPAFAAGAFSPANRLIGFVSMPSPSLLGMLFVDPGSMRRGIGRQLWEAARAEIQYAHPEVKTVELNASPYALPFYRAVGFVAISARFQRGGASATRMACWLPARELGAELR